MKKIFMILAIACFQFAAAQITEIDSRVEPEMPPDPAMNQDANTIYSVATIEQHPDFPGGLEVFYKAFNKNFKIPTEKPDLKGKIFVSFVVEKDGMLSDFKVIRDLGYGTGAQAIGIIKKLPKWQPGFNNGKAVRCQYVLPITVPYQPAPKNIAPILDKKSSELS